MRRDHHKSNPTNSDYGGFFFLSRRIGIDTIRSQRQIKKPIEDKSISEIYELTPPDLVHWPDPGHGSKEKATDPWLDTRSPYSFLL